MEKGVVGYLRFCHKSCKLLSLSQVENECGEIPMVIVQNKIDLMDQAVVTPYVDSHVSLCLPN